MNNQLVRKEDISIFDKVKAFFKGLFSKKKVQEPIKENVQVIKKETNEVQKTENERERLIREIEKNPERVDSLSDEILDTLIRYYRKITSSKKAKIKELKGN